MANGDASIPAGASAGTAVSPDVWKKSLAAKLAGGGGAPGAPATAPSADPAASGGGGVVSPEEWKKSYRAKVSAGGAPTPTPSGIVDPEGAYKGDLPPPGSTALYKEQSWPVWGAERGIEVVGGAAGHMVGGAAGALAGAAVTPVLGPEAGLATYGAVEHGGTALGLTGAEAINGLIDREYYGRDVDLSAKALAKDYAKNYAGSVIGGKIMDWIPGITSWALGAGKVLPSLEAATESGQLAKQQYQEHVGEGLAGGQGFSSLSGKTMQDVAGAQQKAIAGEEEAGRREIIQQTTGATPSTAAAARVPEFQESQVAPGAIVPNEQALAQQKNAKGLYFDVKNKLSKRYGDAYEGIFRTQGTTKLPNPNAETSVMTPLVEQIQQEEGYAATKKIEYESSLDKLFGKVRLLAGEKPTDRQYRLMGVPSGHEYVADSPTLSPVVEMPERELRPIVGLPEGGTSRAPRFIKGKPAVSINDLLAVRSEAQRIAGTTKDDQTAHAAEMLMERTEGLLEQHQDQYTPELRQKLAQLNPEYREFKRMFRRPYGQAISIGQDPIKSTDQVFSNPKLTAFIARNTEPESRGMLRGNFGNWVAEHPNALLTDDPALAEERSRAYGLIAPGTPFANPKSLMYVSGQLKNLEASPEAMARVNFAFEQEKNKIIRDASIKQRDWGIGQLSKFGPVGENVKNQIRALQKAGRPPEEQVAVVDNFFSKLNPKDLSRMISETQRNVRGRMITEQIGDQPPGTLPVGIMRQAARPGAAGAYAGAAGVGAAARGGRVSPFYITMAAMASALNLRGKAQGRILSGLASDRWQPFASALANKDWPLLGSSLARSTAANLAQHGIGQTFGYPLEPDQGMSPGTGGRDVSVGPMSKDIERKQAIAVATDRGREDPTHLDQVQDLNKQVASGKIPDIHHDLGSGRLSNQEVAKLVAPTPTDTSGLFHGMDLASAMDSFRKGTADEKSLSLSALAQKIQNEGQNMQPAQRRALMAQLRQALTEPGEEGLA